MENKIIDLYGDDLDIRFCDDDSDMSRLPCFRREGSYEKFVEDLSEQADALKNGTVKGTSLDKIWKRIDEKIENAKLRNSDVSESRKGA
jgi:hypothetical protein